MLFEKIQLEPNEEVLTVVRKHWFVIVTELLGTFFMLLLPFFFLFLISLFPHTVVSLDISLSDYTAIITFAVAAWSILTLMAGFGTWTHYYLDLWIITDRRIIAIDQVRFFNRNVSMFRLERLQDIEFAVKGVIPTLLNFGTVRAQTAGEAQDTFKTSGLPDPRGIQALIQKAMDKRLQALHGRLDYGE